MRKAFVAASIGILLLVFLWHLSGGSWRLSKEGQVLVMGYMPASRDAAYSILTQGGNAFDAYIAATMVDYVVAPGVTSLAGPLTTMGWDQREKSIFYLNGAYQYPADPRAKCRGEKCASGQALLIPGALRALEQLSITKGKLSWAEVLEPAIQAATQCFTIDVFYSSLIEAYRKVLSRTSYGRQTFFDEEGGPLKTGHKLCQPQLGSLLTRVAENGSAEFYQGSWAKGAVELANKNGGYLSLADFESYEAIWQPPRWVKFNGYEVYGPAGRSFGSLYSMLALRMFERLQFSDTEHYSSSPENTAQLIEMHDQALTCSAFLPVQKFEDDQFVSELLSNESIDSILSGTDACEKASGSFHSLHNIIVDRDGNVVTGTNTINALPWGAGHFVEGVALNNSGAFVMLDHHWIPGEREPDGRLMHIILKDGELVGATGAFNVSLHSMTFQILLNYLFYGMSVEEAVAAPRFGAFVPAFLKHNDDDTLVRYLDGSFSEEFVERLGDITGFGFRPAPGAAGGDGGAGGLVGRDGNKWVGSFAPL